MAIDKTQPETQRISAPLIIHLPNTEASQAVVIEPYHVDLLPEYGCVSREYLMSGVAAGESYCTRLLLRCPQIQPTSEGWWLGAIASMGRDKHMALPYKPLANARGTHIQPAILWNAI